MFLQVSEMSSNATICLRLVCQCNFSTSMIIYNCYVSKTGLDATRCYVNQISWPMMGSLVSPNKPTSESWPLWNLWTMWSRWTVPSALVFRSYFLRPCCSGNQKTVLLARFIVSNSFDLHIFLEKLVKCAMNY